MPTPKPKFKARFRQLKAQKENYFSGDTKGLHRQLAKLYFAALDAGHEDAESLLYKGREVALAQRAVSKKSGENFSREFMRFARRVVWRTSRWKRNQEGFPVLHSLNAATVQNPKRAEDFLEVATLALANRHNVSHTIEAIRSALKKGHKPKIVFKAARDAVATRYQKNGRPADEVLASQFKKKP